jgi:hypothetical protein
MKTLFKRSVCLWLSLAVLIGSVGLTVSEHICLISGKVQLNYNHLASGQLGDPCKKSHERSDCETPAAKPVFQKKCCEYKLDQHKLELAAQVKFTQFNFAWISQVFTFSPVFPTVLQTEQEVLHYTNSSPPLYGKHLLYSLHVLRV